MTTHSISTTHNSRIGFTSRLGHLLALVTVLFVTNVYAEAPAAQGNVTSAISAEEIDKLVGPIALYPDDLIAIILPASTNPLQIVQADRFLEKRKADPKLAIDEGWDDSVKSLLNYPDIVKTMSNDLDWTSALGEAVVVDQGAVLEGVQVFRRKTQSVGNLKSDSKQTVIVEKEVIKIVPADPQVIYVPQYNPSTVVVTEGYSSWGYYPAPYPVYYYPYPPGAAFATGLIWGAAIGAAWDGGHYNVDYHGGNANINIDRSTNINVNRPGTPGQFSGGGTSQWKPNKQPGQVSRTRGSTSGRVGYTAPGGGSGAAALQRPPTELAGGGRRDYAGQRPTTQPSGSRSGGVSELSDSALSGHSSGRQTRMDSSRGAASRDSMSMDRMKRDTRSNLSRGGGRGGIGGRR